MVRSVLEQLEILYIIARSAMPAFTLENNSKIPEAKYIEIPVLGIIPKRRKCILPKKDTLNR